jgi:uncharacterized protein
MKTVRLADCPETPWRNGGGRTRELLTWPSAHDWSVRVSVAEIEADGPFSPFEGIDRCMAVLQGEGVALTWPRFEQRLLEGDMIAFAGESAPECRLLGGSTRDLNLMVRRSAGRIAMRRERIPHGRWRGVFASGTLWWTDDANVTLPAYNGWWMALQ